MPQTIISGVPYTVSAVDGRAAFTLDDFIGAHHLLLTHDDERSLVDGLGLRIGPDTVTFSEKAGSATGKDAREWKITGHVGTGFCAEHVAKY